MSSFTMENVKQAWRVKNQGAEPTNEDLMLAIFLELNHEKDKSKELQEKAVQMQMDIAALGIQSGTTTAAPSPVKIRGVFQDLP